MTTLYISDLDGTLLGSDQQTSDFTNRTINRLVEQGLRFSYATARSFHTARTVTSGLDAAFPVIVYNGTMIKDNRTGEVLWQHTFDPTQAAAIVARLTTAGVFPIVYSFFHGREIYSYCPDRLNRAAKAFLDTRVGDERDHPVETVEQLTAGNVFYITCIGDAHRLQPLYDAFKGACRCLYQKDLYSGEPWLEMMPQGASKANAAAHLATLLRCERTVAFGDGLNDLDLFALADESYAVANALPEVKDAATAVIGDNDKDGVARWLAANTHPNQNDKGDEL